MDREFSRSNSRNSRPVLTRRSAISRNEAGPTDQLQRSKRFGARPLVTPAWIYLRPEAFKTIKGSPFICRTLLDQGFKIPGSSFSAGSKLLSWQPFFISAQVARKTRARALNAPEPGITVREVLRGWTQDHAYAEFSEADKNSIETVKLADFIIVSDARSPCPPTQLRISRC